METLLRGIPGVSVFIDNIFISCETQAEHLELIFGGSIDEAGKCRLSLKLSKCKFLVPSIEFLGHLIDGMCGGQLSLKILKRL